METHDEPLAATPLQPESPGWIKGTIVGMTVTRDVTLTPHVDAQLLRRLEARINVPTIRDPIEIVAPFSGEAIGSVPAANADDVAGAVATARAAQKQWRQLSMATRVRIFTKFHDLLIERADQAIDLVQLEAGKSRVPAFEEVFDVVGSTRYYMNTAPRVLGRARRAVSIPIISTAYEYHHPVGVVGCIVPWNFPFTLGISDMVPALLAGNGVVIKPDEKTPYSALYSTCLLEEAGLPEGLIQIVTGVGVDVGGPLIDNVDFVMFTGSTAAGRLVAERAARRLIGSSLELGGKNAAVVLEDADLDEAIPGIARAFYANGGQLCLAAERIYVIDSIRDEFTKRFVDYVNDLSMTTDYDYSSDMSSLIDVAHMDNVHAHVEDAVAKGARVLTGGKPRPDVGPSFYEATVLDDVDESMDVCRTETFGPVVSLYGVPDPETAIARANDSEFGLNFSIWTRDRRHGVDLASTLEAGTVGVNDGYAAAWSSYDAPMGGFKSSGLSRRHGESGILKYTESQTVAVQRWVPSFAPPTPGITYFRYRRFLGPALKVLRRLPFYK